MRNLIYILSLTALAILQSTMAYAQPKGWTISGKVLDQISQEPIPYATVVAKEKSSFMLIDGTTTMDNGTFEFRSSSKDVIILISFIGFRTDTISDFTAEGGLIDLGTRFIREDLEQLGEVLIVGEQSRTVFKLDKRVFNVGKDISTSGASAMDVLDKVPSVEVNIEGQVKLRGSTGVQILIDGKPSVASDDPATALGTITADMIESIEVITNPSAKYDAEGTSGILNIILKKDEKKGMNGSISINTGIPDNHSIGLSLNRRTEKFNLFTQIGAGYRSLPRFSESTTNDLTTGTSLISKGTSYRDEQFYNITLGTDYHIDDRNVITLSGRFDYEIEEQPSETTYSLLGATDAMDWSRVEQTEATNPKWRYDINYKREFKDNKDHTLLFSGVGNFFGKDQSSSFLNTFATGSGIAEQRTATKFQQVENTFKLDYVRPITDKMTIESGGQYNMNDVGNDYAVSNLIDGDWVTDFNLTNDFQYDQKVLGLYGTWSYEGKRIGVKAGLRMETTDLTTYLATTDERNTLDYTDLFPSAHTSYKFSETFSLQAGYSSRIYRPRLWDLNPFFNISDNFNIRAGNPLLQPEYTDSYELTGIYIVGKLSLNSSIYHRLTRDVIERVSTVEDNVTTTTPYNVGLNAATGVELNGKMTVNKWLDLSTDMNFNYFDRKGSFGDQNFNFQNDMWSGRLTSRFKLPMKFDLELTGNYRSGTETFQGTNKGYAFADVGLRKKLLDGKAVLNLGIRDVFESRIQESVIQQGDYEQLSTDWRGRFITIGLSYGFGKGETMTYSGGRRH